MNCFLPFRIYLGSYSELMGKYQAAKEQGDWQKGKKQGFDEAFFATEAESLPFQGFNTVVQALNISVDDMVFKVIEYLCLPVYERSALIRYGCFSCYVVFNMPLHRQVGLYNYLCTCSIKMNFHVFALTFIIRVIIGIAVFISIFLYIS